MIDRQIAECLARGILPALNKASEQFTLFGQILCTHLTPALQRLHRESTWMYYMSDTCRSPLSDALKPW